MTIPKPGEPVIIAPPLKAHINWVQLSGFLGMLAVLIADPSIGVFIPDDLKVKILAAITAAQSAVTIIIRTWYTGKPVTQPDKPDGG